LRGAWSWTATALHVYLYVFDYPKKCHWSTRFFAWVSWSIFSNLKLNPSLAFYLCKSIKLLRYESKLCKIEVFCQKLQKFTLRFNTCYPIYAKVLAMGSNCSTTNAFLNQGLCLHTFEHLLLRNKTPKVEQMEKIQSGALRLLQVSHHRKVNFSILFLPYKPNFAYYNNKPAKIHENVL